MSTAKGFFAGLYQDAPKPVLVFNEKEELVYANSRAELLVTRLGIRDIGELLTPAVQREAKRCRMYCRGASVSDRLGDHALSFFLTPYPYEEQFHTVIHAEEKHGEAPDHQDMMRVLRNCQGKLNGYLNGIYGRAQIIGLETREGGGLGDEVRRILRMANHLYQLLDRGDHYEYLAPVDVGRFVANCVATANEIDPTAQFLVDPYERELYVRMMPEEMELVLSTLLSNAMRFRRSMAAVSVSCEGGKVYITVRDDGPGVGDPEQLFTWGYRAPDKYGMVGLGSGLVMAQKLLRLQGAELHYERMEGETRFRIVMNEEKIPASGRLAEWYPESLENSLTQMQIELSDYIREELDR